MIYYTIFFATFFDGKMEYVEHKKSLRAVKKNLKIYGQDPLGEESFKVSAKYCYVTHELRLHQNDRCKRFTPV